MLAVLSSATTAGRIKRYLEKEGFTARIIQTPKALSKGGCGYSIVVPEEGKEGIVQAASKLSVRIRGFYREEWKGTTKIYVPLDQ